MPSCTCFAVCSSLLLAPPNLKLRLPSVKPSVRPSSRSRFHWRSVQKQPTRNIAGKERAGQEEVDSDYVFGNSSNSWMRLNLQRSQGGCCSSCGSTSLIQAGPPPAGSLQYANESLRRRFLGQWKGHLQTAKNRNRRSFRVIPAVRIQKLPARGL